MKLYFIRVRGHHYTLRQRTTACPFIQVHFHCEFHQVEVSGSHSGVADYSGYLGRVDWRIAIDVSK
jgi:hypothetical protein